MIAEKTEGRSRARGRANARNGRCVRYREGRPRRLPRLESLDPRNGRRWPGHCGHDLGRRGRGKAPRRDPLFSLLLAHFTQTKTPFSFSFQELFPSLLDTSKTLFYFTNNFKFLLGNSSKSKPSLHSLIRVFFSSTRQTST